MRGGGCVVGGRCSRGCVVVVVAVLRGVVVVVGAWCGGRACMCVVVVRVCVCGGRAGDRVVVDVREWCVHVVLSCMCVLVVMRWSCVK